MVGGSQQNHLAGLCLNAIHLLQELTYDLVGQWVIRSGPRRRDDIQLIEEKDDGRLRACPLKQQLNLIAALPEEAGLDIGCGCSQETKSTLVRKRPPDLCLSGAGRACEQQAPGHVHAWSPPCLRIAQQRTGQLELLQHAGIEHESLPAGLLVYFRVVRFTCCLDSFEEVLVLRHGRISVRPDLESRP